PCFAVPYHRVPGQWETLLAVVDPDLTGRSIGAPGHRRRRLGRCGRCCCRHPPRQHTTVILQAPERVVPLKGEPVPWFALCGWLAPTGTTRPRIRSPRSSSRL